MFAALFSRPSSNKWVKVLLTSHYSNLPDLWFRWGTRDYRGGFRSYSFLGCHKPPRHGAPGDRLGRGRRLLIAASLSYLNIDIGLAGVSTLPLLPIGSVLAPLGVGIPIFAVGIALLLPDA